MIAKSRKLRGGTHAAHPSATTTATNTNRKNMYAPPRTTTKPYYGVEVDVELNARRMEEAKRLFNKAYNNAQNNTATTTTMSSSSSTLKQKLQGRAVGVKEPPRTQQRQGNKVAAAKKALLSPQTQQRLVQEARRKEARKKQRLLKAKEAEGKREHARLAQLELMRRKQKLSKVKRDNFEAAKMNKHTLSKHNTGDKKHKKRKTPSTTTTTTTAKSHRVDIDLTGSNTPDTSTNTTTITTKQPKTNKNKKSKTAAGAVVSKGKPISTSRKNSSSGIGKSTGFRVVIPQNGRGESAETARGDPSFAFNPLLRKWFVDQMVERSCALKRQIIPFDLSCDFTSSNKSKTALSASSFTSSSSSSSSSPSSYSSSFPSSSSSSSSSMRVAPRKTLPLALQNKIIAIEKSLSEHAGGDKQLYVSKAKKFLKAYFT